MLETKVIHYKLLFRLYLWGVIFFSVPLFAQIPPFYQLTDENGLPHNTVYDLIQDKRGFVWANTEDGLVRYDGSKFTKYATPKSLGKSGSLLQEDKNGTIWYRDFTGNLLFITPQNNKIEIYKPVQDLHQKNIYSYTLSSTKIFMAMDTSSQIYYIERKSGTQKNIKIEGTYKHIRSFLPVNDTLILVGGRDFIAFLNPKTEKIRSFPTPSDLMIRSFFYLKTTNEYLVFNAQTHQILRFDLDKKTFSEHPLTAFVKEFTSVSSIKADLQQPNAIWLAGDKGLYHLEKKQNKYVPKFYFSTNVTDILQDREGMLWVSSYEDGIFCFPSVQAKHFSTQNSVLQKNDMQQITHDAVGNFYFCNRAFPMIYKYAANTQNIENWWEAPSLPISSLQFNPFRNTLNLLCNNNNIIAIKQQKKDFSAIEKEIVRIKSMPFGYIGRFGSRTMALFPKKSTAKNIIEGNQEVLGDFMAHNIRLGRFNDAVYDTKNERLWLGFTDGLFYYKNQVAHILKYKNTTIYAQKLAESQDTVLVGTKDDGFFIVKDTTILKHIDTENGLLDNAIRDICYYNGAVWVAHNKGIQQYDIATQKWQCITKSDGLLCYDIQDLDVAFGQVWAATPKGLFAFSTTNKTFQNPVKPSIFITAINGKDTLTSHTQTQYRYGSDNILKIDFQGIALKSKGEYRYKYRIASIDSTWQIATPDRNSAIFPALAIGKHVFEVQVFNEDGIASEKATANIIIYRDWWAVLPFIFATILISSIIFGTIYYLRQQQNHLVLKNTAIQGELIASKLAALRTQMNPHFIFNALSSIQAFMLFNKPELANDYLSKFADLMRHTLHVSQENNILLSKELEILDLYIKLEAIRFKTDFEWQVTLADNVNPEQINLPSMLLQPFVENAFKHGLLHKTDGIKQLTIAFDCIEAHILRCIITDNGIGRAAAKVMQARQRKHKPFAVSATQHRIQLLNEQQKQAHTITVHYDDVVDEQQQGIGTIVEIWIPIDRATQDK